MEMKELIDVYAKTHYELAKDLVPKLLEEAVTMAFEQALPKWHDLRKDPNDLPKKDERFVTKVSETVLSQKGQRVIYYFEEKKWYSDWQEEKVFAWLELPKFKDS
jgi:hypothetical protein